MANNFIPPINDLNRHTAATLIAAGLRPNHIIVQHGISDNRLRKIMREEGWQALLDSKADLIARMMRGDL